MAETWFTLSWIPKFESFVRLVFENNKQSGIVREDIVLAINSINSQALAVDNTDSVSEFTNGFEDDVMEVER